MTTDETVIICPACAVICDPEPSCPRCRGIGLVYVAPRAATPAEPRPVPLGACDPTRPRAVRIGVVRSVSA